MDSQGPTTEILSLIRQRFAHRADAALNTVRDALGRLETQFEDLALLEADDLVPLLPAAVPLAAVPPAADLSALRRAVALIDDDRNQVSILKTLLQSCSEHAPRVALFVARGDTLTGWGALGFTGSGSAADERVKGTSIPLQADTVLRVAFTSGRSFTGPANAQPQNDQLLRALGGITPSHIAAFPLLNKGRVAAILYGDSGTSTEDSPFTDALEILARSAAMSIELAPSRPAAAAAASPSVVQAPAPAPVAAASAPAPAPAAPPAPVPQPPAAPVAAPAPAASPAPGPASGSGRAPAPDLSGLAPEEQQLHKAAMRYARVLVQDLQAYNEPQIIEGRKNRDLYARLKVDIDRSRAAYNEKVNPKVAATTNYFSEELLRALADGDAGALAGYPA